MEANKTIERQSSKKIGEDRGMTILCSLAEKWGMSDWSEVADFLSFDDLSIEELLKIQSCIALQINDQAKLLQGVPLK